MVISSVVKEPLTPRKIRAEFAARIAAGSKLAVAGTLKREPAALLERGCEPERKLTLFGYDFYLTAAWQIPELRFAVAYICPPAQAGSSGGANNSSRQPGKPTSKQSVFARVIYKDLSLVWRCASHFARSEDQLWIGKGSARDELIDGELMVVSDESTTDLPTEMQTALETLLGSGRAREGDQSILDWIVKRAPPNRVEPYREFDAPLAAARAIRRNLINQGKPVAKFTRPGDPKSLRFAKGFEPDFANGILESAISSSRLYGGKLRRFRILSTNKQIQYYFISGPKQVWIIPPQATTTELSSFGVRTIQVTADDDLFVPGYEYHHYEETSRGPKLYSQIPEGYAGEVCPDDDAKADASPWLNELVVIKQFRREVLRER